MATTTDISRGNGTARLLVSEASPLFDVLDHMAETAADRLQLVADLLNYAGHVDSALYDAVQEARAAGRTWQEIGDVLGVSRQAAQQRFGAL
jgi:hypothetical protein